MSDRAKSLLLWAAAVVVGTLGAWLLLRDRPPELTSERLSAAQAIWQARGPRSYTAQVSTLAFGLDRREYEVRVRGGQPTDPGPSGGGDGYTVEALFTLLERELDLAQDPARFGAPQGSRAYLYASFDGRLGYPRLYRRIVGGSERYAEIRVLALSATPE